MKRVGVAFSKPRSGGRRDEYGVYESTEAYGMTHEPTYYVKYEGYREGDKQVGLPLGGPGWREQPLLGLNTGYSSGLRDEDFSLVKFFDPDASLRYRESLERQRQTRHKRTR